MPPRRRRAEAREHLTPGIVTALSGLARVVTTGVPLPGLALYAVGSRLLYVGWVAVALRREDRTNATAPIEEREARFLGFRRAASRIMANDAAAFILLCVASPGTLALPIAEQAVVPVSLFLIAVGIGIKLWAADTLGAKAYYWHNFFVPPAGPPPAASGPYRWLDNPMYTVGYAQAYGLALLTRSAWGLGMAVFYHLAILGFHLVVEAPHYQALTREQAARD